jgi:hypothetical protein
MNPPSIVVDTGTCDAQQAGLRHERATDERSDVVLCTSPLFTMMMSAARFGVRERYHEKKQGIIKLSVLKLSRGMYAGMSSGIGQQGSAQELPQDI